MILNIWDKRVLVFHEERFQLIHVSRNDWTTLCFFKIIQLVWRLKHFYYGDQIKHINLDILNKKLASDGASGCRKIHEGMSWFHNEVPTRLSRSTALLSTEPICCLMSWDGAIPGVSRHSSLTRPFAHLANMNRETGTILVLQWLTSTSGDINSHTILGFV